MSLLLAKSRQRRRPAQENTPGTPCPLGSSNGGGLNVGTMSSPLLDPGRLPPLAIPHVRPALTLAQRVDFGERVLKKVKIDEGRMSLIREYLETMHPEEREILGFIVQAANHDESTALAIQTAEAWKPTQDQAATLRKYAQLLVLLPDLTFFNGALGQVIVAAVTSKANHGFPTDTNEAALETLTAAAQRQVTLALSRLKTLILASTRTTDKVPHRLHLHVLADNILSSFVPKLSTTLSHSLDFYHHIAFIRYHVTENHAARQFWDKVDEEREILLNTSPEDYVNAMQEAYNDDLEKYPAQPNAKKHSLRSDIFGGKAKTWHRTLIKHAKTVTRVSPGSVGRKRKHNEVDEEDEPQEGEPDAGADDGSLSDEDEPRVEPQAAGEESVEADS